MRLIFESAVWVKQIVLHMWVGIIWSAEGLSEMKARVRKKGKISLPDCLQQVHWCSPIFGLGLRMEFIPSYHLYQLSWFSNLLTADLGFLSLHNHVGQVSFPYRKFISVYLSTICLGFSGGSVVKNTPASAGDTKDASSIPGLGRSPERGNVNPLQYSCLGNQRSVAGYSPWGHKESDTTELLRHTHTIYLSSLSINIYHLDIQFSTYIYM